MTTELKKRQLNYDSDKIPHTFQAHMLPSTYLFYLFYEALYSNNDDTPKKSAYQAFLSM